ncbi:MAG: hypothetical protein QXS20_03655 [Candidatus Thorarchaeota archaeon]
MSEEMTEFARRVLDMADSIREGRADPLEYRLTESYRALRSMAMDLKMKLDLDELLNEILHRKVTRVQELVRLLETPGLVADRLRGMSTQELARHVYLTRPLEFQALDPVRMSSAYRHLTLLLEARKIPPHPPVAEPDETPVLAEFPLQSDSSVMLTDLEDFLVTIPRGIPVPLDSLITSDDFDKYLRSFLYVLILISRGELTYDPELRVLIRD